VWHFCFLYFESFTMQDPKIRKDFLGFAPKIVKTGG